MRAADREARRIVSRDQILLKAGIVAMSVAIALTIAAVAVAATLSDEPERAIAAEPAANVTRDPAVRPDLPVKPRVENAERLQRLPTVEAARAEPKPAKPKVIEPKAIKPEAVKPEAVKPEAVKPEAVKPEAVKPEVVKPEVVKPNLEPKPRREPTPEPERVPHAKLQPGPAAKPPPGGKRPLVAKRPPEEKPRPEPEPAKQPELGAKPDPRPASQPQRERSPQLRARADAQGPVRKERRKDRALRPPELPPGAIMSLTIKALGILEAPVRSSDGERALDRGVIHEPDTSLPWDEGSERNVYLVGHRLGWRGTGSYHIFYNLDKLARGDEILLKDRRGRSYEYRVTNSLLVGPLDSWVKDAVPGRDMLTLQTCTPIPTFEKRLIVRASRV